MFRRPRHTLSLSSIYMDYRREVDRPVPGEGRATTGRTNPQELAWQQIISVFPPELAACVNRLKPQVQRQVEEFRLRVGEPVQVCGVEMNHFLRSDGTLTSLPGGDLIVTEDHLSRVLQVVTQSSLYAVEDELRRGFITMPGGHRVGVAGRVVLYEDGHVRSIRNITSLNMRIATEH